MTKPRPIMFDDLYTGRGTLEMAFHPELESLAGQTVVLTGVLAPDHGVHEHRHGRGDARHERGSLVAPAPVILTDEPGICPDCSAAPVPTVHLVGMEMPLADLTPGETVLTIEGTLEYGYNVDGAGNASFIRLTGTRVLADPPA